jgi:NADPH-dependent 2,4-dienoyl-CoA reductase/sulfur reductase-like enzyme
MTQRVGADTSGSTGTVIVGGSVAGVRAATELRRLGYQDPIVVLEAQAALPYDRPPLSKGILTGANKAEEIAFHPAEHYAALGIEVRTSATAVKLDAAAKRVALAGGDILTATNIVIASGAHARPFPTGPASGRVHTIRELADAVELGGALSHAERVAVIGAGFIGAEVASSARALGRRVVVIEAGPKPFENLLGPEVAALLTDLHHQAGTSLRCGTAVTRVEQLATSQRVHLADGSHEDADVVVAGLGAVPAVAWLEGSGLVAEGSVRCDAAGQTAANGIHAIGDVATWADARTGAAHRHEHWTSAREQADIVAAQIAGTGTDPQPVSVPYVWSDQYGKRIQVLGRPAGADTVKVISHDPARGSWLTLYGHGGNLVAVAGCNAAARVLRYRPLLADGDITFDDAATAWRA